MINNISVSNDSLSHVVFSDEAWHILMQQHSMPETSKGKCVLSLIPEQSPSLSQYRQLQALTPLCDGSMDDATLWERQQYHFLLQTGPVSQFLSVWQNFSTIISHRDKVTDRQTNSGSLGPWI